MNWDTMTYNEKVQFKHKYGLHETDSGPIELAQNDINMMENGHILFYQDIEWIKPALKELNRTDLWLKLIELISG